MALFVLARAMRLTVSCDFFWHAALADVPAELQRILATIGELDKRNSRLSEEAREKTEACATATSANARGARQGDLDQVKTLREEIENLHSSMTLIANEKIRLAQMALELVKGNAAVLDEELKTFHKELEEQGINVEDELDGDGYGAPYQPQYHHTAHRVQQHSRPQPRVPDYVARPGQEVSSMEVGDLVAANVGVLSHGAGAQEWIVATVTRYSRTEGVFEIVDADEEAEKHVYRLPQKYVIPLPKTASVRQSQNFPVGTSVLAVYPNTTTFYKAKVVQPARRLPNAEYGEFVLEFEDDGDADGQAHRAVPFRHVVLFQRSN